MKGDSYINVKVGEPTPPENSLAYIVMEERGVAPCFWLKQWCKLTEKQGALAFPEYGTFNLRILDQLRMTLYETKPLPRPAQFEALAVWELVARQQQEITFQRRIRKVEKSLSEARWDWEQKKWRTETLQGVKLFPAITAEAESGEKDADQRDTSSETKKKKNTYVEEEDSDIEDTIVEGLTSATCGTCRGSKY
ncbi:hypothetical protein NDU88_004710 [Pleurodeles waltl]|uniref:Uncharacterized protein n=1 Tax=Pleurodeles waltl TaxID=8319 RepID=A0AAV7VLI9_PLEWA|nr:hypothetical protein NDU88_004710 [Pleurodeles waltl]